MAYIVTVTLTVTLLRLPLRNEITLKFETIVRANGKGDRDGHGHATQYIHANRAFLTPPT